MKFRGLTIGVPREIMVGERRVATIPETVKQSVAAGARVIVERGAGEKAFYDDSDFESAGAEMADGPEAVYSAADILVKVKEPAWNDTVGKHEIDMMREGATLVSFLHPANPANHDMVRKLAEHGITSFTLDSIPRISRAQHMDTLTSMSTVAGYKSSITAAYNLSRFVPMIPTTAGVTNPAQYLVVGSGVAGLQAIATAKRFGATVKSLDIRPEANEQAESLGAEVIPFDLPEGLGVGKGGYATSLPEEWYERERELLRPYVAESDAVVLAALIPGERAPTLITKDMVRGMKRGSVIIDISIDQGGNCELTQRGEEYAAEGVFVSGILNVPASLPIDSSRMFAHNTFNYLSYILDEGALKLDLEDEIIRGSLVTREKAVVHEGTLKAMNA